MLDAGATRTAPLTLSLALSDANGRSGIPALNSRKMSVLSDGCVLAVQQQIRLILKQSQSTEMYRRAGSK
jgi:hypothetical protein